MSVIENAIKRLQASRAGAAALARGTAGTSGSGGAARRRELAAEGNAAAASTRTIVINQDALRIAGLLPPSHQERELARQFRHIKRPLINSALGRGVERVPQGNLIMVASAVPGEGKTFTSLNLALSMRLEEDVTVLLVDGDVVNPRISRILGVENEPGLLDVASICGRNPDDCPDRRAGRRPIRPNCLRAPGCAMWLLSWAATMRRDWCCSTRRRCC